MMHVHIILYKGYVMSRFAFFAIITDDFDVRPFIISVLNTIKNNYVIMHIH